MSKVWVLDTETKGTGAHMVPLEDTLASGGRERDLAVVELERPPHPQPELEPPAPRLFKVVSVMSAEVLAEGVDTREAVEVLEGMRSMLDARIFTWMPESERWRLLTLAECRALWGFRGRTQALAPAPGERR